MRYGLALLFLLLPGCAATIQVGPAAPDPTPTVIGQGIEPASEIVIYRASEPGFVANVAATPALLLDGRSVGTCRFGRPLRLRLPAGRYDIAAVTPESKVNQQVVLDEGETIHLRCGTAATPSLSPDPRLTPVDHETAAREAGL